MKTLWRAVTGFLKKATGQSGSSNDPEQDKMETTTSSITSPADDPVHNNEDSDSDADDEDFVPNERNEGADSEEVSDDEVDTRTSPKKTGRKSTGKKRKASVKSRKSARNGISKRRKLNKADNSDDSEDADDEDFIVSESQLSDDEDPSNQKKLSEEQLAQQELEEKLETDRLWASFLTSVDEEKKRRQNKGQERTVEKLVTKTVDFAGEKVTVQEKVRVTVNNSAQNGQSSPGSSTSTIELSDASTTNTSSSTTTEPVAGPSNSKTNGVIAPKGKVERRGGISILGNDPEAIGLDELDKRGLSGLLKAFQNKAAQAKRIGTLEKSKLDWEQFKRTQGLEEELTHHNKSRDTYIDKQEFLQRTDHRQFTLEKNMRATQRSKRLAN